ncbi:VOC family protein [Zhongshania sp.]|uniref:VOC family protein n=1 Tax=Zhongshania sp. TaxID=1971902 RepID=UPI003562504F
MTAGFGDIMQLGYVVEDLENAAHDWAARVGAGPFYLIESQTIDNYFYRGNPEEVELKLAFGYWGAMQIELIQPINKANTFYNEALQKGAGQLNHCATLIPNLDQLLTEHKLEDKLIHRGKMPTGLQFAYLENYLPGGQHLELIESQADTEAAFAGMQAAHKMWDGQDPLRPMTRLGDDLATLKR